MTSTSKGSAASAVTASERDSMRWLRLTCDAAMTTGSVKALWRWPVIPLAGERLRSTRVDERGVAGDRQHAIGGPLGPLIAAGAPAPAAWRAGFPVHPHGAMGGRLPPHPIVHPPPRQGS